MNKCISTSTAKQFKVHLELTVSEMLELYSILTVCREKIDIIAKATRDPELTHSFLSKGFNTFFADKDNSYRQHLVYLIEQENKGFIGEQDET